MVAMAGSWRRKNGETEIVVMDTAITTKYPETKENGS